MTHHHAAGGDTAVTGSVRAVLVVAAVLVFLAGFQLTIFPTRTDEWFAWTIDVPMTAVFLGAAYWSSAVLEVVGARSAGWGRARLAVWTVLVFTALTLVVTLVHLDRFHLGADQPRSARLVASGWIAIYAGVPLAMVAALALQARDRVTSSRVTSSRVTSVDVVGRPLPAGLRMLLVVLAVVLLGAGVALLVSPTWADGTWAWPLTPLTARVVGAWLVGLGWAAAHGFLLDDAHRVWPLGLTGAAFVLLQSVALLRHGDALDWSSWQAAAYVAGLAWIGVVAAWILLLRAGGAGVPGSSR